MESAKADLYMPVFNRPEFTQLTLERLAVVTNWDLVRRFVVLDNMSDAPTRKVLAAASNAIPKMETRRVRGETVTKVMRRGSRRERRRYAPYLVKIDNDFLLPPRWLEVAQSVLRQSPELDVLGLREPTGGDSSPSWSSIWPTRAEREYGWQATTETGGIFVCRAAAYHRNAHRGARWFRRGSRYTSNSLSAVFRTLQQEGSLLLGTLSPPLAAFSIDRLASADHRYPEAFEFFSIDRVELARLVVRYFEDGHCRRTLRDGVLVDGTKAS